MTKRAVRRTPTRRAAPSKRAPARRKAQRPGLLDQAVASLGVSEKTLQRIATWGIVSIAGLGALGVASWFGIPAMAGVAISEAIGEAGLKLEKIEVTGIKRMDRDTVLAQALDQQSRAMPLIDLDGVRERLLKYPWIEDARISRRLPNTLAIHIVEREPAAVWQNQGQLMLIDAKGEPLAQVSRDAMPDLPLLIGDNANGQEEARRRLMEAAPELQQVVRAASWIGNRRWDLVFDTGERLQLPEGEAAAVAALSEFAQRDARERLLGGRWQRFDMRDPRNFILCCRRKADPASPPAAVVAEPSEQGNAAGTAAKTNEGQE